MNGLLRALGRLLRDGAPNLVEVSTYATDPRYFGIGSGPNIGDMNGSALTVLPDPTLDPHHRQMLRLCAYEIPRFTSGRLVRFGQYQEMAQRYPQLDGSVFEAKFPVNTNQWSFDDGNIATMIRVVRDPPPPAPVPDFAKPLRASPDVYGVDPALIYLPSPAGGFGARYTPPMAGIPPGWGPGDLHIRHDLSHRFQDHHWFMDYAIDGPALVTMWASLWQTNPATRGTRVLPPGYNLALGLVPEDGFLSQSTQAIYSRVAGSMTFELHPHEPLGHTLYSKGGELVDEALAFWERIGRPKGMGG